MKNFEKVFFVAMFIIALAGLTGLIPKVVMVVLLIGIIVYLGAGWYFLDPEKRDAGNRALSFGVSYLISQTLVTVLFGIRDWPLKETMAYATLGMTLIAVILFTVYRKKLKDTYPVDGYIIRLVVCFMFAGSPIWMV